MFKFGATVVIGLLAFATPALAATCSVPYPTFTAGTTAVASQVQGNFSALVSCANAGIPTPTRQVLTSGSTYTTPAGARQLRIRMVGGGGGGGGVGTTGTSNDGLAGGDTIFNSVHAAGGAGTTNTGTKPGVGGTGGTGTASFRAPGNTGAQVAANTASYIAAGQPGPGSMLGGGSGRDSAAIANTGSGGPGTSGSGIAGQTCGAPGGSGEYVELNISSPASSYTYTIGAGGAAGGAGTGGSAGQVGGSGIIIVDEYY